MTQNSWETTFELYRALDYRIQSVIRDIVVQFMIEDGFEEIGSSDVNHAIYGEIRHLNTKEEIVDWALQNS